MDLNLFQEEISFTIVIPPTSSAAECLKICNDILCHLAEKCMYHTNIVNDAIDQKELYNITNKLAIHLSPRHYHPAQVILSWQSSFHLILSEQLLIAG